MNKLFFFITINAVISGVGLFSQTIDSTSLTLIPRLSFYSNEKSADLLLHLPQGMLNNQLNIKLIYSSKLLCEMQQKADNEIIKLPLDLTLIDSSANIEAEVRVMKRNLPSGGIRFISRCNLIILPHKSNEVKIDRLTGGLIVNGRQFYPFGFYCYSPVYPTLPEEEVVKGFNMISPYQRISQETFQERKAYMDRCAQLGMKVHYNLLSVSGGGGVGSRMKNVTDLQKRELLINELRSFMNHPALLAWYISDEPNGNKVSPATLEEIYKVVKEIDPWHPVSIVFMAPFLSAKKYANAVDIVMADPYPIPNLPASMVADVAGNLKKEFHGEKSVWIVPQAFGGGEHWSREPSIQEIRSMTYQSIINGATGIQYFVRQGLNSFPKSVSTWSECGRMALEIAELTPWLLSDEESYPAESSSKNISVTTRIHNGKLAVLVVNKVNEPQRAEIRLSGNINTRAKVIFENRNINCTQSIISDVLPAFGSQVYMADIKKSHEEVTPWPGNLIIDPGFEDITSTGIPAACYAKPGADRGATYFLDTREHIEGNHSLRVITPKESNGITLKFFPVTVTSGNSYILSVWVKADPEQRLFEEDITPKSSTTIQKERIPQQIEMSVGDFGKAIIIPQSKWKQYVALVTVPEDSVQQIKVNVSLKMPGQGVAWFDLLQMIEDPLQR